ncbi:hypothetical protein ESCO_003465 [Escovopsis weberi]|uniref:YCII-related domain-containing protein n=1 Tax=Escovopsis weberi TaxID=150374 RepID=A0A0M9VXE3_ESCWE|nr:hypothetical protein ESCO_003465 [Escovopsis weberi]
MASAPVPAKFEYLVIIPDKPNSAALRQQVREAHLTNMKAKVATGDFKEGGALLNKVPESMDSSTWDFRGSSFVVAAHSQDEVVAHIKDDIYYQSGVWDLDNAQIMPFFCAFRLP